MQVVTGDSVIVNDHLLGWWCVPCLVAYLLPAPVRTSPADRRLSEETPGAQPVPPPPGVCRR
jgi:hypothetical protein